MFYFFTFNLSLHILLLFIYSRVFPAAHVPPFMNRHPERPVQRGHDNDGDEVEARNKNLENRMRLVRERVKVKRRKWDEMIARRDK